jgi:hypothetical protein
MADMPEEEAKLVLCQFELAPDGPYYNSPFDPFAAVVKTIELAPKTRCSSAQSGSARAPGSLPAPERVQRRRQVLPEDEIG